MYDAMLTIGGLLTGTLLSLFDIPIMHTLTDDVDRWVNQTFFGRDWHWPVRLAEERSLTSGAFEVREVRVVGDEP